MACLLVLGCVLPRNDSSKNTKAEFKLFPCAAVCRLLRETISSARMSSFDTSTRPAKMEVTALKTACSCPCAGYNNQTKKRKKKNDDDDEAEEEEEADDDDYDDDDD